jgi:hypothetical protein
MKKLLFVLFALVFVTSLSYGKQISAPVSKVSVSAVKPVPAPVTHAAVKAVKYETFIGVVDSVSVNVNPKASSSILVVDEKGQKKDFLVRYYTIISAKDGKLITLNEIKKDNKVTVQYRSQKVSNKAVFIQLLE